MKEILRGFSVVDAGVEESRSVLTIRDDDLRFNKAAAKELGYPPFVQFLVNKETLRVAILVADETDDDAVPFSQKAEMQGYSVVVRNPMIVSAVKKVQEQANETAAIHGFSDPKMSYKGTLHLEDGCIIFDLTEPKTTTDAKADSEASQPAAAQSAPSARVKAASRTKKKTNTRAKKTSKSSKTAQQTASASSAPYAALSASNQQPASPAYMPIESISPSPAYTPSEPFSPSPAYTPSEPWTYDADSPDADSSAAPASPDSPGMTFPWDGI